MPMSVSPAASPPPRFACAAVARVVICALALILLVSACGLGGRMSPGEFQDRAREVVERWHGSKDDLAWRTGFVPLEGPDIPPPLQRIPDWAPLSVHNGAWALDVALSGEAPRGAQLSWPDGSTLTVPLVAAATAYAELSRPADFIDEECPPGGCTTLHVTGAELGDAPLRTGRGTIRVPVWYFTVKGVRERFGWMAVDPSAIASRPVQRDGEYEEVMAYGLDPVRPRDLLLQYGHGRCEEIHGARAYETDDLVVVDVDLEDSGGPCTLELIEARTTVTLARPLGDRLLLDSGTGLPVLNETLRR
ncbi:hypothetical protein ACFY05_26865 [Microtetraspora fusca]|uniref:Uncharacterized protein n=1 Tax=Microtetraspora fusca TaxID=1997 RepID=A0ABW6VBV7_MICFU